jgi:peptidoglycan/LPS O-acetylase OafA/YrhL
MVVGSDQLAKEHAMRSPEATAPTPDDGSFEEYSSRHTFGSLDALRAISILAVIWHHAHGGFASVPITLRGFLGVDMFFVLSGFLIVTLLLREQDRSGDISLPKFYMRRTLRIFPLYYAIVLGLTALMLVRPDSSMAGPVRSELPYLLTYTSNWVHSASILAITWSLATEEQFYLLWPPLEKFGRKFILGALVVALGVNQAVNFGLLDPWFQSTFGVAFTDLEILASTFTPILLGVALAHAMHSSAGFDWVRRVAGFRLAPVAGLLALTAACSWPTQDISGLPRLSIQLAMTWWLATLVVREKHLLAPVTRFAPLVRIGVVSYGMYLLHMFALSAATRVLGEAAWERVILCAGFTWIAAEFSFRIFESPILRFKKRFDAQR